MNNLYNSYLFQQELKRENQKNELTIEKKIINFISFRNEFNLLTDAQHLLNYFHTHNILISKQTIYSKLSLLIFEEKIFFKYYRKPNAFKKPTKIYFINN